MKKLLLICIGLLMCGCSAETNKGSINGDKTADIDSRIRVVNRTVVDGASLVLIMDTKTGREFLYYSHSMVEIKPKDEK